MVSARLRESFCREAIENIKANTKNISRYIDHDPGLLFGTYYRKLMLDEAKEEDIEKEADSNIAEIYKTSYEYIQGLDDKQLRKFIKYFRNKIKLIERESFSVNEIS